MGRSIRSLIAYFLLAASATPVVLAQDIDAVSTEKALTDQNTRNIEEITVVGERTFIAIRFQIRKAEDDLYAMFNKFNSSDEFDIKCRKIKLTKSYIPVRHCEPKFLTRARQSNSMMALSDIRDGDWERGLTSIDDSRELREKEEANFEALNAEMLRIATEQPEYLEMLGKVGKLKAEYAAMRQRIFGD